MDQLTIPIPDGLTEGQKTRLVERLARIAAQEVERSADEQPGSLMDLAGSLKHDGPPISKDQAREAAKRYVVDNFRDHDS